MAPKKLVKKAKVKKIVKPRAVKVDEDSLDHYGLKHAQMLFDPCGSDLSESVYPGDRGYINRFNLNGVAGVGTGITNFAIVVKPGNGIAAYAATQLPGDTFLVGFGNSYPGAGFMTSNANKFRDIAHCTVVRPIASPNNATGSIHYGVTAASALPQGFTTSCTQMLSHCTQTISCSQACMAPLEIKWSPGTFDDRYCATGVLDDDNSDRNVLVIVGIGLPANTGVQTRMVSIREWQPTVTLGVNIDATAVNHSRCNVSCVLRNLKRKDPEWWWQLGRKTFKAGRAVAGAYYSGGMLGAAGAALKYV